MTDIVIRGMEMPKCCGECPLTFEYYSEKEGKNIVHCQARLEGETRFVDDFDFETKPEEGCPLVEVKEVKEGVWEKC